MANTYTITINEDDFGAIKIIRETVTHEGAFLNEQQAATALMEIGLSCMLSYPTSIERVDTVLKKPEWQAVISKLKAIWCM